MYLTCKALKFCFPVQVQQGSLRGWDGPCTVLAGDLWAPGRTPVLEQGSPSQVVGVCESTFCALQFLWQMIFSGTDLNVANQRHYVTVLAAFLYVFPLFGMLFYLCISEPVLWDGFHSSQLDQGTIHTTLSLSSCHSSWRSRDCPVRHASQKKTQFICSQ